MRKRIKSRRNRSFKVRVNVRDTANRWPQIQAIDALKGAMGHTVTSHDLEGQSKVATHAAAVAFNQYLGSFPHNLFGKFFGFTFWRIPKSRRRLIKRESSRK